MIKDKALDLALEFCEFCWRDVPMNDYAFERLEQTITAIKQALASPAVQEPVAVYGYCPFCGGEGAARERHPFGNDRCVNGHKYKSIDALTTPPAAQRQWVGLTEEDVAEGLRKPFWEDAARAIEAKLKEKNNG